MSQKNTNRNEQKAFRNALILKAMIMCAVIAALSVWKKDSTQNIPSTPRVIGFERHEHTKNAIHRFFAEHMQPVISSTNQPFCDIGMPDVEQRYIHLMDQIAFKYGKLEIHLVADYSKVKNAGAGSFMTNGIPVLEIYVPADMDIYERYAHTYPTNQEHMFQCYLIMQLNHELEHIYGNYLRKSDNLKEYDRIFFEDEARAWAKSCEYTIAPLVEKYGHPVLEGIKPFYDTWVRSGRNVDSPEWKRFIQLVYADAAPSLKK